MLPQLDLSTSKDDLKPSFNYIKIDKKLTVATDGHIMSVFKTSDIFEEEFINTLPDDPIFIHREDWFKVKNGETFTLKNDIIEVNFAKKRAVLIKVETEYTIGAKYPEWENVIPTEENTSIEPLSVIGMNAELLAKAQKILGAYALRFEFFQELKGVLCAGVSDDDKGYCLIMPVYLDPQYRGGKKIDTYLN